MFRVARAAAMLPLLSLALAGCSGDAGDPSGEGVPEGAFDGVDAEATAQTGVIRGIVIDEAITPLADAAVTIPVPGQKPLSATTTESGAFAFGGLAPGTYFVKVSKPGYQEAQ